MTLTTFGTTAASRFYDAYDYATDNNVGQAVKNYGVAETLFSAAALLTGVKVAQVAAQGARTSWKKGETVVAVAWSAVAVGSLFLAGWEICRATRSDLSAQSPVQPKSSEPVVRQVSSEPAQTEL